ncbi:MAG: hypothetical protein P8Y71_10315 [Pseudolabrys sp.]
MASTTAGLKPSDEGDKRGLALGRAEGEAFTRTLKHMLDDVAEGGGQVEHGDYLISYAFEEAEGMYAPKDGRLEWEPPGDANIHIEVGTHRLPLLWHPYLYHYGRNWKIPGDGTYSLRVRFPAPQFHRHDKKNGDRFPEGADVTFKNVKLETGKEDR